MLTSWKQGESLMTQRIETERLLLLPLEMKYVEQTFKEFTPEITKYMYPRTPERIEETIENTKQSMEQLEKGTDLQLAILDKKTEEFLGRCGLHNVHTKTPEMGIWIKKGAHGLAYGREAMKGVKNWADKNLDYEYIIYPAVEQNIASRKIAEFLGGKLEKTYQKENMSGVSRPMVEYWIYR